jgi:hypothetical protein
MRGVGIRTDYIDVHRRIQTDTDPVADSATGKNPKNPIDLSIGRPILRTDADEVSRGATRTGDATMATANDRKITFSGNWRPGGPDREWAGTGTVDGHGTIECSADLGDEVYEAIEDQIAGGDTEGIVTIHDEEQDRDITYFWAIVD